MHRCLLTQMTGDLKFLVETFRFEQNYMRDEICKNCDCTKAAGILSGYNFAPDAPWTLTARQHEKYMRDAGDALAVCRLPGWHLMIVSWDLLHYSLHLGTLPITIANAVCVLLDMNYFSGPTSGSYHVRFEAQLQTATLPV